MIAQDVTGQQSFSCQTRAPPHLRACPHWRRQPRYANMSASHWANCVRCIYGLDPLLYENFLRGM